MHYTASRLTLNQVLMAMILDNLNFLAWAKTKDAKHGRYSKKSVLKLLQGEYEQKKDDLEVFETIEEYEEYMKQFIK